MKLSAEELRRFAELAAAAEAARDDAPARGEAPERRFAELVATRSRALRRDG